MTWVRLMLGTVVSAALILPAAGGAQTYAPPSELGVPTSPQDSEAMIPYASDQPSQSPGYGQDAYGEPGNSQPTASQSGYDQNSEDRYDHRRAVERGYDRPYAADAHSTAGDPDDQRSYGGRRDLKSHQGEYGPAYGYPKFRAVEQHIRDALADSVRDDLLEPNDASDLIGQLRRIQQREAREYRIHGPDLPSDEEARIADQLNDLVSQVDRARR